MLIELMIVVATTAVLLEITIPAYHGYAVRAKVTEALYQAVPVTVAGTESLQEGTAPGPARAFEHILISYPLGMCQP